MSQVPQFSPFKFLDSYGAGDEAIFFGRDREVEEVYDKVFQSKLLLVYGASGSGKSSIINCGLANKFDETDWFPIRVRRGGNIRRSLFNQINKEAIRNVELSEVEKMTNEGLLKVVNSVYLDHFKPIYLIFDQFEELFIFGFKDEWQEFISSIRFLMDTNLDIHFIFIIRGEYLEFLSEFEELIPEFFDNRMRVEKMTRKRAEETINGPAAACSILIENGFEEKLLRKLSPDKSHIELTFLQVFLDKIYKKATKSESGRVHFSNNQIEEMGQLGDVLAEFVDEQIFQMEDPKGALTVLKSFVSLQGTKVQNSFDEVVAYCQDLGLPLPEENVDYIIRSFINKRILKDHDDSGKYELRHDSLAQKIFEKITNQEKELLDVKQFLSYSLNEYQKRGTLLSDEDIGYVAFYERNLEIAPEIRSFINLSKKNSTKRLREKKTRTIFIALILLLLVTSVIGFIYSQVQKNNAEALATLAETEKVNAERQKERAHQNEQIAITQAKIAENQSLMADRAKNEAENQRIIAIEQRSIAENQRLLAEKAREEALLSEKQALAQKAIADEQRNLALRLRTLSLARELAIKSSYMANKELKALLSLQAYHFNKQNNGNPFDPDIYQSLYLARKEYFADENLFKLHESALKDIQIRPEGTYTVGNDGKLVCLKGDVITASYLGDYAFEKSLFLNNDMVALAGQDGSLILFDLNTHSVKAEKQIHSNDITAVVLSGNSILTSSLDGKLIYSNKDDLTTLKSIDVAAKINDMVLFNDQIWILTDDRLSTLVNGQIKNFIPAKKATLKVMTIDETTNKMYIGSQEGDIWVWHTDSAQTIQVLSRHSAAISDIKISQNHKFLASSSLDRTVRLWPLTGQLNQPIILFDHDNWASTLAFTSNQLLTGSYSGSLRIFELNSDALATGLCDKVQRSLSIKEWNEYISKDIIYQSVCDE